MNPTILWSVLAVIAIVGAGIAIVMTVATRNTRAAVLVAEEARSIHQECAATGHTYTIYETGFRCVTCGNHVSRREGELYGLAEEGRVERRRDPR